MRLTVLTFKIKLFTANLLNRLSKRLQSYCFAFSYPGLHFKWQKFKPYTMIPCHTYVRNLQLVQTGYGLTGSIVECGSWRGGMIAGIASVLGADRDYYVFDSFEGLPQAKEIDGFAAIKWQSDKGSQYYFNNCKADFKEAQAAMILSGAKKYKIIKGWFSDTLKAYPSQKPIAILRLDGDWYESTITCLEYLYPKVVNGGIIILDDYHVWEGCRRAVHDYLSREGLADRICQWDNDVSYIIKQRQE
jgi:O-methyltransferase